MKRTLWFKSTLMVLGLLATSSTVLARGGHGNNGQQNNGGHPGNSAPAQHGNPPAHHGGGQPAHVPGNPPAQTGGGHNNPPKVNVPKANFPANNNVQIGNNHNVHIGPGVQVGGGHVNHPGGVNHTNLPNGQPGGMHHHVPGSPQVGHHLTGTNFPHQPHGPNHPVNHLPPQTHFVHQNHYTGNSIAFGNHYINFANTNYRPAYYRHGNYYHGYWNGNRYWGGYGGYGWGPAYRRGYYGYSPYFWGLGGWGLGSLIYSSGYTGYYNPYYLAPSGVGYSYNYAQPIPVSYNASMPVDSVANTSTNSMDSAVAAFRQNNYDAALDIVNKGIQATPDDAVLHEFRGLVLFARGDYQLAAATVHSVLAVGPGWDWTTMSGLYADVNLYSNQLRALEGVVKQSPQDAAAHFLLAYHYMADGYPDAATRQLEQVVTLMPNDAVAANLLKMTAAQQASSNPDSVAQPTPEPPTGLPPLNDTPVAPIDTNSIAGNWKAKRDDGSRFSLTLTGEKTFRWSYQPNSQPEQAFDGTYSSMEMCWLWSEVAEVHSSQKSRPIMASNSISKWWEHRRKTPA